MEYLAIGSIILGSVMIIGSLGYLYISESKWYKAFSDKKQNKKQNKKEEI